MKQISSIVRAGGVLLCLSNGMGRITDIAHELGISKSSVHGILKTLETIGFAAQESGTRQYYLGPSIQSFAANPLTVHQILASHCRDELKRLRGLCGETVGVHLRQGTYRVTVEELESLHALRFKRGKGLTAPIYVGSPGKVMLSLLDENELVTLIENLELIAVTPATVTDKEELLRQVRQVREQGYAVSLDETYEGAIDMAAPIRNYTTPAALGIIGPSNRFNGKHQEMIPDLIQCARQISQKLKGVTGIQPAVPGLDDEPV